MSNDASRSNNGAFSYRHARQQNAAASNPYLILNFYRQGIKFGKTFPYLLPIPS